MADTIWMHYRSHSKFSRRVFTVFAYHQRTFTYATCSIHTARFVWPDTFYPHSTQDARACFSCPRHIPQKPLFLPLANVELLSRLRVGLFFALALFLTRVNFPRHRPKVHLSDWLGYFKYLKFTLFSIPATRRLIGNWKSSPAQHRCSPVFWNHQEVLIRCRPIVFARSPNHP